MEWRELKSLRHMGDCFRRVDSVLLCANSPDYALDYVRERTVEGMKQLLGEYPKLAEESPYLRDFVKSGDPVKHVTKLAINSTPTRILVVTLDAFEQAFSKYLRFMDDQIRQIIDSYKRVGPL